MNFLPAECQTTSLELVAQFNEPGFCFEEKMDGIRALCEVGDGENRVTGRRFNADGSPSEITKPHAAHLRSVRFASEFLGSVFDGELMPDGEFWIFDVLAHDGVDLRKQRLRERKAMLAGWRDSLPEFVRVLPWFDSLAELGEFGEGVVVKDLLRAYGHGWWKAKRVETDDVMVLAMNHDTGVADVGAGRVCGVPASVQPGDLIEVVSFGRFPSGALRNGRFVRVRDDKPALAA